MPAFAVPPAAPTPSTFPVAATTPAVPVPAAAATLSTCAALQL